MPARAALEVDLDRAEDAVVRLGARQLHGVGREVLHERLQALGRLDADDAVRPRQLEGRHEGAQEARQRARLDALQALPHPQQRGGGGVSPGEHLLSREACSAVVCCGIAVSTRARTDSCEQPLRG